MTRIILIRHGETDYNLENKYCGFSNPPLNDKGKWQSKRLTNRLKDTKIDKIYSSDLRRALQSAKIIFDKKISLEKVSKLREINFGMFEGLKYRQIIKQYPEIYKRWLDNPLKNTIPNGESLNHLAKRVRKVLRKILDKNANKTIAIFTHSGPIKIILLDALKLSLNKFWQIEPRSASVSIIKFNNGKLKIESVENVFQHSQNSDIK